MPACIFKTTKGPLLINQPINQLIDFLYPYIDILTYSRFLNPKKDLTDKKRGMTMNQASCPFTPEASNWLVVGALASPHILYAFIWYFPQVWRSIYGRWSVQVFESLAWILKGAMDGIQS